jgi:hypothetical protein
LLVYARRRKARERMSGGWLTNENMKTQRRMRGCGSAWLLLQARKTVIVRGRVTGGEDILGEGLD